MGKRTSEAYKTTIGGQALIEGIMMRGVGLASMACRLPDGSIDVETWPIRGGKDAPWYRKVPFLRGIFNFAVSLTDGYRCISKSAEKTAAPEEENENPSKFELWLEKVFGDKLGTAVTIVGSVLGILLAVGLFVYLPALLVKLLDNLVALGNWRTLVEGIFKIVLFVTYIGLTGLMKDLRRMYEYHGAEHKTIACYEAGEELTVDNVRKQTRFHPRCGTSFILIVFVVSILVLSVFQVSWDNVALRMLVKLALLPLVVGISYEIIRLAGRHDNIVTRIISAPGLCLQRLTTREPDDSEMEVGIAALKAVLPANPGEDRW